MLRLKLSGINSNSLNTKKLHWVINKKKKKLFCRKTLKRHLYEHNFPVNDFQIKTMAFDISETAVT